MSDQDRALVANAADEEQVQKATEKENRDRNELERAWRVCMNVPEFKIVMRDLWKYCGPFESPFREDDRRTCLAIARADVARYTVERMEKVNPSFFIWLTQETMKTQAKHGRHTATNARGSRPRADRKE